MRTKKFRLSLAVAGLLVAAGVTSAAAEIDGWFVGAEFGYRSFSASNDLSGLGVLDNGSDFASSGTKFGILGGRQHSLADKVGLRYYLLADSGSGTINLNANVDALYTFTKSDNFEFRGFAGAWVGYASHGSAGISFGGLDLGLNVGLRGVIKDKHGIELYGHFGFLSQEHEETYSDSILDYSYSYTYSIKVAQPFSVGLRYTYSF